jgi:pantetheine-phosphate adenylyltransferase
MSRGVYAGTFDPITNGHMDIIRRALTVCDELVIAIGINPAKKPMFDEQERISLIAMALGEQLAADKHPKVSIKSFQGLLVDFAHEQEADVLVRGIRSVSDFEYEINLANVNKTLNGHIESIFLPTSPELAVVSSSMVKEIARHGADISQFVAKDIAAAVEKKLHPPAPPPPSEKKSDEKKEEFVEKMVNKWHRSLIKKLGKS